MMTKDGYAIADFWGNESILGLNGNERNAAYIAADHSERNLEKFAPDCRNCANRGRVNGLSQESYCDGCVYQGRSWRQNHFVLAVKRRCEACAILPCSCK